MNRSDIINEADSAINVDRAATHGDAENSFNDIATLWNWWIEKRGANLLSAFDVAMMMDLFKTVRAVNNPSHIDNYIDKVGYTAIAGEIISNNESNYS
jgi:hypothetical protein